MKRREHAIEWLKAAGITIIVVGHLIVAPPDRFTFPIYPKQIGVALFMFVLGWNLGKEHRDRGQVLFHRMFPMYLFGLGCAVVVGIPVFLTNGNVQLSNLLPFMLGMNVFFDFFPANPTTWFIGTYFHALVFWFFIAHRLTVRPWHLVMFLVGEIAARAWVMTTGASYVAYMMLPTWLTPFFLGVWMCRKGDLPPAPVRTIVFLGGLMAFVLLWRWLFGAIAMDSPGFPFKQWAGMGEGSSAFIRSALISVQYLLYPMVLFCVFRRVRCPAMVSFISRNSLVIFIGHMPLIYGLAPFLYQWMEGFLLKRLVLAAICLVGLGLLSEGVTRGSRLPELQKRLWNRIQRAVFKPHRPVEAQP